SPASSCARRSINTLTATPSVGFVPACVSQAPTRLETEFIAAATKTTAIQLDCCAAPACCCCCCSLLLLSSAPSC
uniref:Secreted protein n=1 Tax=Macrostomum lignano TaxID=282301 RepID=A0A1I8I3X4_9PLAT